MKVLVIAMPSGLNWRLMFRDALPVIHTPPPGEKLNLVDDFGQEVSVPWDNAAILIQDTQRLDELEVEMMIRQKRNEMAAMQRLQTDPRNMIMTPGGLLS